MSALLYVAVVLSAADLAGVLVLIGCALAAATAGYRWRTS